MRQQVNSVSSTVVTIKPPGRTCLVLVMALCGFFSVFYDAVIAIWCMQIQCIYINTGLQITGGHWTLADQTLLVSDEIQPVFRHYLEEIFYGKSFQGKEE